MQVGESDEVGQEKGLPVSPTRSSEDLPLQTAPNQQPSLPELQVPLLCHHVPPGSLVVAAAAAAK